MPASWYTYGPAAKTPSPGEGQRFQDNTSHRCPATPQLCGVEIDHAGSKAFIPVETPSCNQEICSTQGTGLVNGPDPISLSSTWAGLEKRSGTSVADVLGKVVSETNVLVSISVQNQILVVVIEQLLLSSLSFGCSMLASMAS